MTTPAERTVTELTKAQITEARNFAEDFGLLHQGFIPGDLAELIAHIRREARNAALEEAAFACHGLMMSRRYGPYDDDDYYAAFADGAELCRNDIRALKDQP